MAEWFDFDKWVVGSPVEITDTMRKGLVEGEQAMFAYKYRKATSCMFTNKRIFLKGDRPEDPIFKVGVYTYVIPYKSIDYYCYSNNYSSNNLKGADLYFWTKGGRHVGITILGIDDIRELRNLLAECIVE